jgi:hypothetical protein
VFTCIVPVSLSLTLHTYVNSLGLRVKNFSCLVDKRLDGLHNQSERGAKGKNFLTYLNLDTGSSMVQSVT